MTGSLRLEALPRGVRRIVLTRPEVRNAFDETMIRELRDTLARLAAVEAEALRVLVLAGEGKVFSAGADLSYMKRLAEKSEQESFEDAMTLAGLFHRLADFPAPVVAVVQGAAIGGGLGLTVCADYVLAEERAVFATSEVRLGIVPGVISPYIVRKLGLGRAAPFMLSGTRLSATEAKELGLVQRIAPVASLPEVLDELLAAGPEAARRTKSLLKAVSPLPDDALVERTARQIAEARCSAEGRHGLDAFFRKTSPDWTSST